jgi:tryptophan-rich sensory protein
MSFLDSADEDPKRAARRPLLIFILLTLVVGAGASIFTEPSIPTWYAHLAHPAIAPPNWVFAPVWTTLYVLMAVAAWRVWRTLKHGSGGGTRSPEMIAYGVQLALNFAWSAIFFAAHQIGLAMIEIGLLVLAILVTAILFFRRDRLAGLLFLPYLGWTAFAAVLTHAFWLLNP